MTLEELRAKYPVALLAEGVGRNLAGVLGRCENVVALLAEGVGRNISGLGRLNEQGEVALLAEGVGRNF